MEEVGDYEEEEPDDLVDVCPALTEQVPSKPAASVSEDTAALITALKSNKSAMNDLLARVNKMKCKRTNEVKNKRTEEEVRAIETHESKLVIQILEDVDAKISGISTWQSLALQSYTVINGTDVAESEIKTSIQSMKVAVSGAQDATAAASAFLDSRLAVAAKLQTWKVRERALSKLEAKRQEINDRVSELEAWKPMMLTRVDHWQPQSEEALPAETPLGSETQQPRVEEGTEDKECDTDPIAKHLKSMGLISETCSDNMQLPSGAENFMPALQRVITGDVDARPVWAAAPGTAKPDPKKKPFKVVVCRSHDERCTIRRSKKPPFRRFFCCPLTDRAATCGFQRWADGRPRGDGGGGGDGSGGESN